MTPGTERRNAGQSRQLTFVELLDGQPKPTRSPEQHRPPVMFTKAALYTGNAGPTRFDPEHDPELQVDER